LGWDDRVPDSVFAHWQLLYSKLPSLNRLSLPRWTGAQPASHLELHGFADASTHAYAAVVYLKAITSDGDVTVSLLAGKSRVAPISPLTVPRLELSAALLLSRLILFVRHSLDLESVPCTCWTDSTIVLTWLRSHPSRWTVFVANRVAKIQKNLPQVVWRHVPTACNPADCASRGLHGDELVAHKLWWSGPPWLISPSTEWPMEPDLHRSDIPEQKKVHTLTAQPLPASWDLATRFSSWPKLVRVTAYLYRFLRSCRSPTRRSAPLPPPSRALTSTEYALAKRFWIRYVQDEVFRVEMQALRAGRSIASKSSIASLNPFLDDDGVLR
ncbi:PREDICTED: uncharacterized protein LOC105559349, partial [Vollenhovia emeryi]|uniref:uncharacterized protein LOC105559349 n=1 Tax=Vollenhovia emeryi TaxID=411798 RepID=UPI0005F4407C